MSSLNRDLSLNNPTWEYLHSNFRKAELQKHCRDLGMTKVWVTKEKLIDMIMEKRRSSQADAQEQESSSLEEKSEIVDLKERLNIRDLEIEEMNEVIKAAQITINKLNDRLSALEEQVRTLQGMSAEGTTVTGVTSSENPPTGKTLLLGDKPSLGATI